MQFIDATTDGDKEITVLQTQINLFTVSQFLFKDNQKR